MSAFDVPLATYHWHGYAPQKSRLFWGIKCVFQYNSSVFIQLFVSVFDKKYVLDLPGYMACLEF